MKSSHRSVRTVMSYRLILVSAAAIALFAFTNAGQAGPLVLYWDMNNVSGSTVADQSGNGHTGAAGAGVTFTAPNPSTPPLNSSTPTQVADLTGNGSIYSSATANDLGIAGNAPKSVSIWVDAASSTGGASGVFQLGEIGSTNQDFSLRVNGAVGNWRAQFWGNDTDFSVANSADHWVHFVMVYDPNHTQSANNVTIYANGVAVATGTQVLNTATSGENFAVGAWANGFALTGQIDDAAVFNIPLSQQQVTALFNGGAVPEPSSFILAGLAAIGLFVVARRRRKA